jgi:hypothetical protein
MAAQPKAMQMSKMIAREQVRKNGGITGIYVGPIFSCSAIIIRCAVVEPIELRCSKFYSNIVNFLEYSQIFKLTVAQVSAGTTTSSFQSQTPGLNNRTHS